MTIANKHQGRMVNILHLVSSFDQGGSEKQAIQLAARLAKTDGFKVFLGALRDGGRLRRRAEELGLADSPVFPVTSFYGLSFIKQARRFRQFLKMENIDIVHCHDFYTNVFGFVGAMGSGSTTVVSKRETTGTRTKAQNVVEMYLFQRARAVVVNSEAVSSYLVNLGVPKSKIDVIYNGVEIDERERSADRETILRDLSVPNYGGARFVTLVANLHLEVKNQTMLLRAAKQVIAIHPEVHFIFAGEGPRKEEMEFQARELGVSDHTHFIGHCARVSDLLRISFAGVLTSNAEGFSNAILEYMAAGLPVVATDVGGAREAIIDERSGFIVSVNDADALASRIMWLLNNVTAAEEMGKRGRAIVEDKFSPDAQLKKTIEVYDRLLGPPARLLADDITLDRQFSR